MFKTIYPSKDTTLYERAPVKNTGVDSILQLVKQTQLTQAVASEIDSSELSGWNNTTNSRILLQFDYTALSASLAARTSSPPTKYILKLFVANSSFLPYESTIEARPLVQQWTNGTGFYRDTPSIQNGANWYSASTTAVWDLATANGTGSYASVQGGGVWHTGSQYLCTNSYNYDSNSDLVFDVTSIVAAHLSSSISNYGIIIKWDDTQEQTVSTEGMLSIYSRESYTVFVPKLIALWDDADQSGTGSFAQVSGNGNYIISVTNLKNQYYDAEKPTLRLHVRDSYPTSLSYSSSAYVNSTQRLPIASYFCITDSVTDAIVLDYDTYNRIGCDSSGNFIKFDMNCFQPERYYYLNIKSEFSTGEVIYTNNVAFFRVSRV